MEIGKFNLIKTEGRARRGEFCTAHGVVQTPVFQNVGTAGAIKGAVDAFDLKELGCQIELSNTYHLHVRPGDQIVKQMGGLHKFMRWDGPMLTDSGGFQVFSLATLRKIKEEGDPAAARVRCGRRTEVRRRQTDRTGYCFAVHRAGQVNPAVRYADDARQAGAKCQPRRGGRRALCAARRGQDRGVSHAR